MKLSIIIPVLNSHEIVRRQVLHYGKLNIPDNVEILFIDDGSDPPIVVDNLPAYLKIYYTNDTRPWTWALARNGGAKLAKGEYFLMTDLDYIITQEAIDYALTFTGDKIRFKRQFGILDENGDFTQDVDTLLKYGLLPERVSKKGLNVPPHPNNFVMRSDIFWDLGGYREDRFMLPYPQGEDRWFKREWMKAVDKGKYQESEYRPTIYMFPNGQFCGNVDYNPFGLFHKLSRRTDNNPFLGREKKSNLALSVIIPSRNEEFLERTINDVLDKAELNTEVICVLDGYWPDPTIPDRKNVTFIHHVDPIGQRAGTNEGAKISKADYIMKLDAHCILDQGFDRKLIEPYENGTLDKDTTTIPLMYNLHGFDWVCKQCDKRTYQGPKPDKCECGSVEHERDIVWHPWKKPWADRERVTDSWMFDKEMHFQYWRRYSKRPEAKGDIVDIMSSIGACFLMPRQRFYDIDMLDENHGSWGQFGTEIACKSWLSGGRQVVNKNTWFSHLFRTQRDFGFPYDISGNDQERAKIYSRDLWLNDKWPKAKLPLKWLVDKFAPVPTWHEEAKAA